MTQNEHWARFLERLGCDYYSLHPQPFRQDLENAHEAFQWSLELRDSLYGAALDTAYLNRSPSGIAAGYEVLVILMKKAVAESKQESETVTGWVNTNT